jgi:large subunit ribosomal protein L4
LRPQKGSGRARQGDAGSPLLRGGGKTFGPKPRDFSTGLNQKMYDMAWRTALSYRYRRGELIVCADGVELPLPRDFTDLIEAGYLGDRLAGAYRAKAATQLLEAHRWGRGFGRTTFVTTDRRPELFDALAIAGEQGRALELADVDVKDLLETGRIVIEREALREMIQAHQRDLVTKVVVNGLAKGGPALGETIVG